MKKIIWTIGVLLLGIVLAVALHFSKISIQASSSKPKQNADMQSIIIGAKNFTEQRLLSEITAQYLTHLGYKVEMKADFGSTVLRNALVNKQIDLVWEYTGTAAVLYHKIDGKLDADQVYEKIKQLDAANGLVWLKRSHLNNTYALAMREEQAAALGIHTISDLMRKINAGEIRSNSTGREVYFAFDMEFANRPDGLPALFKAYPAKINRKNYTSMYPGAVYLALRNKNVDVGLIYLSDGRIDDYGFRPLIDDKQAIPSYVAAPVIRREILNQFPALKEQLIVLADVLNTENVRAMNAEIDIPKANQAGILIQRPIKEVAAEFLQKTGLIPSETATAKSVSNTAAAAADVAPDATRNAIPNAASNK